MPKDKSKLKRKLMELLFSSSEDESQVPKKRRNRIISSDSDSTEKFPPETENTKSVPQDFLEKIGFINDREVSFELNTEIVKIWRNTLTKGLESETKKKLIKDNDLIKGLSTSAPTLNNEIKGSFSQSAITRDNHLCEKQNQIGSAFCGLSQLLNKRLKNDDKESAEKLSNCIRLLCDVHYLESKTRRSVILPGLHKNLKDAVEKTEISDTLFGKNLSDLIKESKIIEKSTKELRPYSQQSLNTWGPSAKRQQQGGQRDQKKQARPAPLPAPLKRQQQQRRYLRSLTLDKQKPQNPTRFYRRRPY